MTKVLITGATGLLGRTLYTSFKGAGFEVVGCGFSRAEPPLIRLDLTNPNDINNCLTQYSPDIVIHAAAERKPDICENNHDVTLAINVSASENLAKLCANKNIRLFFISTDYVFDGKTPPYSESATTHPVNFYGRSKQLAEQAILAVSGQHTIIRVPVLYGQVTTLSESAITVIAEQLKQNPIAKQDNWAIRYPTHIEDIALTLIDLAKLSQTQTNGVFHISGNQAFTKYQMALIMAEHLGLDSKAIAPLNEPSQSASRPHNCALADTRLKKLGIDHQRDFETAIKSLISN